MEDIDAAFELQLEEELLELLQKISPLIRAAEIEEKLSGEHDALGCFLEINAGSGGTEACAWAEMLARMYLKYFRKQGWDVEIVDWQEGDAAGVKTVMLEVVGDHTYGRLKNESGVHRLIRVSPFDSNARVHTSFAGVDVRPKIEEDSDIEILDKDLEWEPYKGSGPGGQHQNKTESAIRLKHLPSGVVVQSATHRCQHQNRRIAKALLASALLRRKEEEHRDALTNKAKEKSRASFGSQIRSYAMNGRNVVTDERTGKKVGGTERVLEGHLEDFM